VELFVCHYQKPEQGVLSVAVTSDKDWTTAFTFAIAPQDLDAFAKSRTDRVGAGSHGEEIRVEGRGPDPAHLP